MVQIPPASSLENAKRIVRSRWKEKATTFSTILAVNLAIFILLGTVVVYSFVAPKQEAMVAVKVKPAPPPPAKPPARGGDAARSLSDPTTIITPPQFTPPSVIASTMPSNIKFTSNNAISLSVSSVALPTFAQSTGLSSGTSGGGLSHMNPFGDNPDSGVPGLIGDLYDLKQTPDGTPTPIGIFPPETTSGSMYVGFATLPQTREGLRVLREYVKNWDQSILDHYYKSPAPLEATQIYIASRPSEEATKAFKVADKVFARRWVIHYHGAILPSKEGRYRFLGFGDDFLVVRLGGTNVLDGSYPGERLDESANGPDEAVPGPGKHILSCGKWFNLEAGASTSIDVLIGEGPGGVSGFTLLIEEEGDTSEKGDYPVFQMAAAPLPPRRDMPTVFNGKTMLFTAQ